MKLFGKKEVGDFEAEGVNADIILLGRVRRRNPTRRGRCRPLIVNGKENSRVYDDKEVKVEVQ